MTIKTLIVVVGPTASGKTALAIRLAQQFQTEIISGDARQFFTEMNIGTARPTQYETQLIPHHLVGHISINQPYSAGLFETEAQKLLSHLFQQHNQVILVGGSGMYIKALCEGFDVLPDVPDNIRIELNQTYIQQGLSTLQQMLAELDPVYYKQVDLNNPQRIIRALEICKITKQPYSSFRKGQKVKRDYRIIKIGLDLPREELYLRINNRVEEMMQGGLLQEVEQLLPYKTLNALKTVGYTELFEYLDQRITLPRAVELIKQNTRHYAKRQMTWFKKDPEIRWFNPNDWQQILNYLQTELS